VRKAIGELSKLSKHLTITGTPEVPWFPTHLSDLEHIGKKLLSEGEGIEMTDHPGFNDPEYKKRRNDIMQLALNYHMYDFEIPRIEYTKEEQETWTTCYKRLMELYKDGACKEHLQAMSEMERYCGFSETNIP
jgi:hypothetical protein